MSANEEATSPESSTGQITASDSDNSTEEQTAKKILGRKTTTLSAEDQRAWDNQPKSTSLEQETSSKKQATSETEAADEKPANATSEQIEGLKKAREKLLAEVKQLRREKRQINADDDTGEAAEQPETSEEVEPLDTETKDRLEVFLNERDSKNQFYSSHPDIYSGEAGAENRHLIEDYLNLEFGYKTMSPRAQSKLRSMAHSALFGKYETEQAIDKAKKQTRQQLIKNELAALGSDKGKTLNQPPAPPRKRVIPIKHGPANWY